jgi:nucleotide-binding universal stress UspA family protein
LSLQYRAARRESIQRPDRRDCVSAARQQPPDRTGPPPWGELLSTSKRALQEGVARQVGVTGEVTLRVSAGGAAEMLLATAEDWRPDVLAIGTHLRGAVTRLLLGRVAENVVRQAKVPVLVASAQG